MMGCRFTFTSPRAVLRIERILASLVEPMPTRQLCAELHMCKATAVIYLAHLRDKENKRVRIAKWKCEARGRHTPVYALGSAKDAPEPARQGRKVAYQKEKAKRLADPHLMARYRARRHALEHPPKAANDPLMKWMMQK